MKRILKPLAMVLTLAPDWLRIGQTAALVAVGLHHPDRAAVALTDRLTAPATETEMVGATPLTAAEIEPSPVVTPEASPTERAVAASAMIPPPGEDGTGGKIVSQKIATGDTLLTGIAVKNRSGKSLDVAQALRTELTMRWQATDQPQVLIVHTHTTEGYMLYDAGYYNQGDRARKIDSTRGVCAVGNAIADTLAAAGIAAIHDTTVHDSPKYTGAYTRSEETVKKNLEQYPSIRVVLDIHRDAIMKDSTTLVKPTVTVNGKKAAQMMIIAGVVSTSALPNPNCAQNFALATQWQRALGAVSGELMRPVSAVASRYNQHLHAGYLLVEVGSEGNTLDEAVYSGQLLGKTLAELLQA